MILNHWGQKLLVGHINYANTFPIFWHLEQNSGYRFVAGVPSYLNEKLRNGEIDVGPVSSLEYMNHSERYRIMPSVGICAKDTVQSVILFSDYPIEALDGKSVFVTPDSLASTNLLKIIFEQFYNISPQFIKSDQPKDAYLLIGDNALRQYHAHRSAHRYDLAEIWYQKTGLPFVFSLWLVSENSVNNPKVKMLYKEIMDIIPNIQNKREFYADEYLKRFPDIFTKSQLMEYWSHVYYSVGDLERRGLELYYKMLGYEPQWYYFEG